MKNKSNGSVGKVYEIVTEQVMKLLEQGTIPWRQPWAGKELPQNLITKIPYKGINLILLSALGFQRNYFITPKQLEAIGAKPKEGAKYFPVVFWKWPEKDENASESDKPAKPWLRYYTVFNIEDCEGIPDILIPPLKTRDNDPIKSCSQIVANMPKPPEIRHVDQEAYYLPQLDVINVPEIKFFDSSEKYYVTLFHEMIHSTGHPKRLNREEGMKSLPFGSEEYSQEELVAELGACFLEAHAGISSTELEQNASYIKGWLRKLRNDKRFLVYASSQAQKAADYILSTPLNGTTVMQDMEGETEAGKSKRPRGKKVTVPMEELAEAKEDHPTFVRH